MAVYRKGFHALNLIQKESTRIFSDACDFGTPTKKGDKIWNSAKQLVDWYGDKETKKVNKYSTGVTVECEVTLIDEWAVSDERKNLNEATERYKVVFC